MNLVVRACPRERPGPPAPDRTPSTVAPERAAASWAHLRGTRSTPRLAPLATKRPRQMLARVQTPYAAQLPAVLSDRAVPERAADRRVPVRAGCPPQPWPRACRAPRQRAASPLSGLA